MNSAVNENRSTPDRLERPFEDYTAEELFELFKPPKPGRVEATAEDLSAERTKPIDASVAEALANLAARDDSETLSESQS